MFGKRRVFTRDRYYIYSIEGKTVTYGTLSHCVNLLQMNLLEAGCPVFNGSLLLNVLFNSHGNVEFRYEFAGVMYSIEEDYIYYENFENKDDK